MKESQQGDKEQKVKIYKPQPGLQEKMVASNVDVMFSGGAMSSGKSLSINELVLTPSGWKRNGDLQVGDEICTPYNGVQKISALFPQGILDIYELETLDGRRCECSLDHLWKIRTPNQVRKHHAHRDQQSNFSILTTKEIIGRLEKGNRVAIPLPDAIEFPEKELPIDPYALGVLIGDGCLTLTHKTRALSISNTEMDIIQRVSDRVNGTKLGRHKHSCTKFIWGETPVQILRSIEALGLDLKSPYRFIPEIYLWGSIQQRKDLLAGLFDTDGYVSPNGSFVFSTTSERLKNDVIYLARSLGYNTYISLDKRTDKYTSRTCYVIGIRTEGRIFYSEKHNRRYDEFLASTKRKYTRPATHATIKSIKFLRRDEAQCLYIEDRDHLYITRDFLVTHNTFGTILSLAEPIQDPNFRAVFLRRNLNETKVAGGMFEDIKKVYASFIKSAKESDNPRITFKSGAFVELTHISDESPEKLLERIRGWQMDMIYFDEGTSFEWTTFRLLFSRNRGTAKWTNKIRLTCNPKKSHWIRVFIKDYIGPDGFVKPDWDGRIRYFYIKGKNVEDVVWGDTPEEVYSQCRYQIDEALEQFRKKGLAVSYQSMIKSFTFYLGSTAENTAMMGKSNASYIGSVAAMGEAEARANLLGNWNVDPDEEDTIPIKSYESKAMFLADPQVNNDRWITVDLADTGTDNTMILVWDGFHIFDFKILVQSTPRMNYEEINLLATKHGIGDSHIIYDGIRAAYMIDYMPQALPFISYRAPMGKYGRMADNLKAECYMRLVYMIVNKKMSFADDIAKTCYRHANLMPITFQTEFEEECSVVRFQEGGSGRKRLMNKKDMNARLGKGRSMDLLDSCAMRMLPVLNIEYGEELTKTAVDLAGQHFDPALVVNVFDESVWN